jgi:hypothetical protein
MNIAHQMTTVIIRKDYMYVNYSGKKTAEVEEVEEEEDKVDEVSVKLLYME